MTTPEDDDVLSKVSLFKPNWEFDNLTKRGDYFSAFALAVAYFEYLSYKKLRNRPGLQLTTEELRFLSTRRTVELLKDLDLITESTRKDMHKVIDMRTDLIHPKGNRLLRFSLTIEQRALIDTAKQCIETLMAIKDAPASEIPD